MAGLEFDQCQENWGGEGIWQLEVNFILSYLILVSTRDRIQEFNEDLLLRKETLRFLREKVNGSSALL